MAIERIVIEDTSDCVACTARAAEATWLLRDVKCRVLEDATCQECGRAVDILVVETGDGE